MTVCITACPSTISVNGTLCTILDSIKKRSDICPCKDEVTTVDGGVPDSACVLANSASVGSSTVSGILSKSLSLIIHAIPTAVTGILSVDCVRGCDLVAHCTIGASSATGGRPTIVGVVPMTRPPAVSASYPGGNTLTTVSTVSVVPTSTCS